MCSPLTVDKLAAINNKLAGPESRTPLRPAGCQRARMRESRVHTNKLTNHLPFKLAHLTGQSRGESRRLMGRHRGSSSFSGRPQAACLVTGRLRAGPGRACRVEDPIVRQILSAGGR